MAAGSEGASGRRGAKSKAAFRTISEVAEELDVAQHVLRFWETKFHQIRPLKRGGGRRYYRPEDIDLLRQIKSLLYTEGYTIKGVQRLLRQVGVAALLQGSRAVPDAGDDEDDGENAQPQAVAAAPASRSGDDGMRSAIERAIAELEACRRLLADKA
ncbi:MAG: MerR family transcriptional regulator [Proteobacteria bacterium]|nr:MerR family transcriptional regulator [Pseudomonadota bacterium]